VQDAGLQVFSKSFWGDFWLVYKNSHIVMSCFLVHPDRHFTATKRFWLLIVSLFMAWGLSAILAPTTVRTLMFGCDIDEIIETASQDIDEAPDVGIRRADQADECYEDIPIEVQVILAAASCLLQLGYDSFAEVVIKCACFQKGCGECIRICCEGIGGIIFSILAFLGTIFLLAGVLITMLLNGDVVSNIIYFVATKGGSFLVLTSGTLFFSFVGGRMSQMKPTSDVLKDEKERSKWEEDKEVCCCACLSCICGCCSCLRCCFGGGPARGKTWNYFIGKDVGREQLPDQAPDHEIKVSLLWRTSLAPMH